MGAPGKLCLKCGYQRTGQEDVPDIYCPQCGRVYAKVEASRQSPAEKQLSRHDSPPVHQNREHLKREVPVRVKWGMRALIYPFVILVGFSLLVTGGLFNASSVAMECDNTVHKTQGGPLAGMIHAKNVSACMAEKSGFLTRHLMLPNRDLLEAMPNAPCRFVGVWNSRRQNSEYTLTLKADSTFYAVPVHDPDGHAEYIQGAWGEYDDKLVWFYQGMMEANPIETDEENHFDLIEKNGSLTEFSYRSPTTGSCPR